MPGNYTVPTISVLMCVRNAQRFLTEAVASVLEQTFSDFELIVVDDASEDNTPTLLASFRDGRLKVLRNQRHSGIARSRNLAFTHARGQYLAVMDGDDICAPDRLRQQLQFLHNNPATGVVGTFGWWIDETGQRFGDISLPEQPFEIAFELYFDTPIIHSSVMMRRAIVQAAGGYATSLSYGVPLELWLRLIHATRIANLAIPLINVRHHEGRVTVRHMVEQTQSADRTRGAALQALLGREVSVNEVAWWRCAARGEVLESEQAVSAVADLLAQLVRSYIDKFLLREGEARVIRDRAHARLVRLVNLHAEHIPRGALAQLVATNGFDMCSSP